MTLGFVGTPVTFDTPVTFTETATFESELATPLGTLLELDTRVSILESQP